MSKVKDFFRRLWRITWRLMLLFFLLSFILTLLFKWVPIPVTPLMLIRYVEKSRGEGKARIIKDWVPLNEISPHLHLAVVASEDQNFLKHNGLDFGAIEKAIEENKRRKRPRGASTITQQTVKNVFLWQGKNFIRKGLEVYFSFLVEMVWGKERILEVYLNVIEMGDGIYGAEAASQQCFGKPAASLTPAQAATIAAVLPNPRRFSCARPSGYIIKRRGEIQKQMRLFGGRLRWNAEEKKK